MKQITIEIENWTHTCADGCCFAYGERHYVNGKELDIDVENEPSKTIKKILNSLGYEVRFNYTFAE